MKARPSADELENGGDAMLTDDTLRRLTDDRRRDREHEAADERLADQARRARTRELDGRARAALLGHLVAARRHALR